MDVHALRQSFALIVGRAPDFTHRFYEDLFARHPEARPLFGRNTHAAQERMLAQTLAALLDHLEDASWLRSTLGALGERHQGYGVTREMYAWVGDSLLATLADVAGTEWTAELDKAWTEAYGAIQALLLAGAVRREADTLPPGAFDVDVTMLSP